MRPDFGRCYRCNGFGTLNPNGSKKKTASELREEREYAERRAFTALYENKPRFMELKKYFEKVHEYIIDFTGDYEIAQMVECEERGLPYNDDYSGCFIDFPGGPKPELNIKKIRK